MFHNYFFLKRLSASLENALTGYLLLECFSQNKDELILGFGNKQEQWFVKANLLPQIGLLQFTDDYKRAKKNSVDLFPELLDAQVTGIKQFIYERSFAIHFNNGYELIFKMHGSRSNLLLASENRVLDIFRSQLPGDLEVIPEDLHNSADLSEKHFKSCEGNPTCFLPALGKEVKQHLKARGYHEMDINAQWQLMQQVLSDLESNPIRIFQNAKPQLSLLEIEGEPMLETFDPIAAANDYFERFTRTFFLDHEKQRAVNSIEQNIKKTSNYLKKTYQKLEEIQNRRGYDELANILMANLHEIKPGMEKVTLYDFYRDTNLTLKLKPNTTPQKYAENLYRKAKNQKLEVQKLEENITERENQLEQMQKELTAVRDSEDFKSLRKTYGKKQATKEVVNYPYNKVNCNGYDILIGKNARHNDELTLKVATKNDLWLHAKDVPGSHVVIRHQAGKNIPKDVLERAAELAAWYSKRKTDSLCPVIYTPKKYVRKVKGSPAGAVIVEKEEVMMVEPKGI